MIKLDFPATIAQSVATQDIPAGLLPALANVSNTTSSTSTYDFISRFFAPASGIDEDPVTGSAHCTLAPFWAERLNKSILRAFQASRRGGEVTMDLQKDRVLLSGEAVTVFSGELYV